MQQRTRILVRRRSFAARHLAVQPRSVLHQIHPAEARAPEGRRGPRRTGMLGARRSGLYLSRLAGGHLRRTFSAPRAGEESMLEAVGADMPMRREPADVVDRHVKVRVRVEHFGGQSSHRGLRRQVGGEHVHGRVARRCADVGGLCSSPVPARDADPGAARSSRSRWPCRCRRCCRSPRGLVDHQVVAVGRAGFRVMSQGVDRRAARERRRHGDLSGRS